MHEYPHKAEQSDEQIEAIASALPVAEETERGRFHQGLD
jgi:hypothetical protein